jgi:hypothetical protein
MIRWPVFLAGGWFLAGSVHCKSITTHPTHPTHPPLQDLTATTCLSILTRPSSALPCSWCLLATAAAAVALGQCSSRER